MKRFLSILLRILVSIGLIGNGFFALYAIAFTDPSWYPNVLFICSLLSTFAGFFYTLKGITDIK